MQPKSLLYAEYDLSDGVLTFVFGTTVHQSTEDPTSANNDYQHVRSNVKYIGDLGEVVIDGPRVTVGQTIDEALVGPNNATYAPALRDPGQPQLLWPDNEPVGYRNTTDLRIVA